METPLKSHNSDTATQAYPYKEFLPISREDMKARNWDQVDFVIISGDAYVDHPSFGAALIGRLLESEGYRVGIIAQPDWNKSEDFTVFGRPRLAFLISSGNMDSMVMHYTAAGKPRSDDVYSPDGKSGKRPKRAVIVYSAAVRTVYKKMTIVIGGIEASLRRLGHYDYWSDSVRRSILLDAKADLAIYGMAEKPLLNVAQRLAAASEAGQNPANADLRGIPGTVYKLNGNQHFDIPKESILLPEFKKIQQEKKSFAESFAIQHRNADPFSAKPLAEKYPSGEIVIQMPPEMPYSSDFLDKIYELPYTRMAHPSYEGGIAALKEVQFSMVSSRGCFGGCSFCALTFHQGKNIQVRSHESLIREAKLLSQLPGFKGYIHDVGGPTANFRIAACNKMKHSGSCPDKLCLKPCKQLKADHSDFLQLLRKLRKIPGIKKVFIRSGIRYDYLLEDPDSTFFSELVEHHISGQLKVAPEHVSDAVLRLMGKPGVQVYQKFQEQFAKLNKKHNKKQFLVPYFISGHPGSSLKEAIQLAEFLRDNRLSPQQVQDFYPTPGTLSSCMYHTGLNPLNMQMVIVPKGKEKTMQRALLQYRQERNHEMVRKALMQAGRHELIGNGPNCLVPAGGNKRKKIR